jgi:hypothetical protein
MKVKLLPAFITISCALSLSCAKQPDETQAQKPSSNQTFPSDARFDVAKSWFQESLAIRTSIQNEKDRQTEEGSINVANLDTGYPFVIIELALKAGELRFKTSEAKLADPDGNEYKLDGTAAFSIENYSPLPPSKGTIFDSYPLNQTDSSGGRVSVNRAEGAGDIEVKAEGKGTKLLLIFAAPRSDGLYKLSLSGSTPISVKPAEETAR